MKGLPRKGFSYYDSPLPGATNHIMFETTFNDIDCVLWKEAACTELDYAEQTSWLLFLKYLDDLEQDKSTEAERDGKKYTYVLDKPYRWESWPAPKRQRRDA